MPCGNIQKKISPKSIHFIDNILPSTVFIPDEITKLPILMQETPNSMAALTKNDIVEMIEENLEIKRTEASETVETLLEILKSTLEAGEDIMISGFGKFQIQEKKARKGRNPATGGSMTLPARKVVTFKCSGKLRDHVNGTD